MHALSFREKRSCSYHTHAFSLVELLVVIAVIGIISAIAMNAFSGVDTSAKRAHAQSTAARLNAAVALF
jgi:prepilin-type N-terminal cleavage/methylation domain-containing protein